MFAPWECRSQPRDGASAAPQSRAVGHGFYISAPPPLPARQGLLPVSTAPSLEQAPLHLPWAYCCCWACSFKLKVSVGARVYTCRALCMPPRCQTASCAPCCSPALQGQATLMMRAQRSLPPLISIYATCICLAGGARRGAAACILPQPRC